MRKYISILVLLCGVLGMDHSVAQIVSNPGSGHFWDNPATWVGGVVPGPGDNVIIADGSRVRLNTAGVEVSSLTIGQSNSGILTWLTILDGASLIVTGNCVVNSGGYDEDEGMRDKFIRIGTYGGSGINTSLQINGNLIIGATNNQYAGLDMIGMAQLELLGNMNLPSNRGYLKASATAILILRGVSQQIYMGGETMVEFPNLLVDGSMVEVVGNSDGRTGYVGGDLIVRNGGTFNNSGRQMKVNEDIIVEEGASFHLSGGATISVDNETRLFLNGTLITEHIAGLDGFNPLLGIDFGDNAEIVYKGTSVQRAGFTDFVAIDTFPRLVFENTFGVNLDASVLVKEVEIKENAIFNGVHNGNVGTEFAVVNGWTNNGLFNGLTGTVRLVGNMTSVQGTGVNNFNNLVFGDGVIFAAPALLTLTGSLIVEPGGTFNSNAGTVVFNSNGSSATTSGVGQFNNVTVNRGLVFAGNDTINGVLYLQNGISDIVGSLTLDLNTGYIDPAGNAVLNGDISFIKSASKKGYTAVSLPVASVVSDLKNAGFQYVLKYDDKAAPNYLVPLSNTTMLAADGRAYACHADATNSSNPEIRLTGSYNNARSSVSVPVVSTPVNGQFVAGYTGWNLIGNPFAFDVDWDELLQIAGNSSIYPGVYYQMGDYFQSYIAGVPATGDYNRLGPMQGVMVYLPNAGTTPINNTFTFSKDAGLGGSNILRRKAQPSNVLKLNVSNGQYSDATYVRLSDEATIDFDPTMDAYKFRNGGSLPSFFSYREGVNYSINSVPATFANYSMLLAFEPKVAGSYTITLSEEYLFDLPYEIYLEDKVLNILHPIGSERSYTFTTNLGERAGRFALHFENAVITAMEGAAFSFVRVFSEGRDVMLTGAADVEGVAEIKLYDITGRMVARYGEVDLNNKSFNFKVSNPSGVYIVSVVAGERVYSERIVIY